MVMGKLFGVFEFDLYGKTAYLYSFGVLFMLFVVLRRLVNSPFGLSLRGIREGGRRMPAIGANVDRRLNAIFTIGAAVAGVAGALLAQTTQFVGLDVLGFPRSAELLIMLVLGGTGRLYGALIGAAVFMVAQDNISGLESGLLAVLDRPVAGADRAVRTRRHHGRRRESLSRTSASARSQHEPTYPAHRRALETMGRLQGQQRRHRSPSSRARAMR